MTAIIRVKRHFQDDTVEAIRLECKRQRTEEAGDATSFEKVLNFVGTVNEKDDFISQRTLGIPSLYQQKVKELKKRVPDVLAKARQEMKSRVEKNRYKVLSCLRARANGDESNSTNDELSKDITIVDVSLEKNNETTDDNSKNFVYDLYSTNLENEDYDALYYDNLIGIEAYLSDGVFDMSYRNSVNYLDEDFGDDDDDSNDEDNWRNFYPDEEEESDSEEIDVLTNDFGKFGREDSFELSSDDDDEKYTNYIINYDKNSSYYREAKDFGGVSYAKYKMNILNSYKPSESIDCDEDEETY